MSITFIASTMEICAAFVVLKLASVYGHLMHIFMTDGIVDIQTMQKEHLAIYVSLGEVNFQHPSSISVPSSVVP